MGNLKVALLVVLLVGAIAGLAWRLGDYARPVSGDEPTDVTLRFTPQPREVIPAGNSTRDASPRRDDATIQFAIRAPASDADLSAERSMVGLPFRPSESVVSDCLLVSWRPCSELKESLDQLAAEPRNADWARDMEARIEKAVVSGERGKFRIRALECRSTRCALEVASEVESIGLQFDSDPAFDEAMFPRASGIAREDDAHTGVRTIVSVQTWQTWEAFEAGQEASE